MINCFIGTNLSLRFDFSWTLSCKNVSALHSSKGTAGSVPKRNFMRFTTNCMLTYHFVSSSKLVFACLFVCRHFEQRGRRT